MSTYKYGTDKVLAEIDNELRDALVGWCISSVQRSDDDEVCLFMHDGVETKAVYLGHSSGGIFVRRINGS